MARRKFRELADHASQGHAADARCHRVTEGQAKEVRNLDKGDFWESHEPLGKPFPTTADREHQMLALLGHGDIDILYHARFPGSRGVCDTGFHAAEGDPSNLKVGQRGEWEERMLVETVLSMLTLVCHFKKVMHRGWEYFHARLAFTMAAFNVLVQWHGFQPTASGFVPLSIAEFSL